MEGLSNPLNIFDDWRVTNSLGKVVRLIVVEIQRFAVLLDFLVDLIIVLLEEDIHHDVLSFSIFFFVPLLFRAEPSEYMTVASVGS